MVHPSRFYRYQGRSRLEESQVNIVSGERYQRPRPGDREALAGAKTLSQLSSMMSGVSRVTAEKIETTCAIAGGGPAGMMLGFLLARAGVQVVVLEKHADFLRDFRGDTIHPSTLELMHELGLLSEFLKLPHQELRYISAVIGKTIVQIGDLTHLPTQCRFVALMPQWDFLDFLAKQGARYPAFNLRMEAEDTELVEQDGRFVGVRARTPTGELAITAALVVGADGRHSTVRERAGLVVYDLDRKSVV